VCCVLCAVCCVLCAVCCVLCAVCCVLCAVCCVLCAVWCALCVCCVLWLSMRCVCACDGCGGASSGGLNRAFSAVCVFVCGVVFSFVCFCFYMFSSPSFFLVFAFEPNSRLTSQVFPHFLFSSLSLFFFGPCRFSLVTIFDLFPCFFLNRGTTKSKRCAHCTLPTTVTPCDLNMIVVAKNVECSYHRRSCWNSTPYTRDTY
jgi:hypothetical protein